MWAVEQASAVTALLHEHARRSTTRWEHCYCHYFRLALIILFATVPFFATLFHALHPFIILDVDP
jgi:hypothetical protein